MKVFTRKLGSTALGTRKKPVKRRKRRAARPVARRAAPVKRRKRRAAPQLKRDSRGRYKPTTKRLRHQGYHDFWKNPIHLPRTARGRPAAAAWWILDVVTGSRILSYVGKANKTDAERDAMRVLVKHNAEKVTLAGPYRNAPSLYAKRV